MTRVNMDLIVIKYKISVLILLYVLSNDNRDLLNLCTIAPKYRTDTIHKYN